MRTSGRSAWTKAAGLMAIIGVAVVSVAARAPSTRRAAAEADFSARVAAYLVLEKSVAAGLPSPEERSDDPARVTAREIALGNAVRAARAGAKQGDIFTHDVARVFRHVIKNEFRRRPLRGQKVMRDDIPHFRPRVNQTYPSTWPLPTFPAPLFAVLPALPAGLEYRLLSEALIIRDAEANIIVDFILDVF